MTYKNKIRILCAVVLFWSVGTVIGTHVGAEPYPAIAFPGFGLKSTSSIIYTEFYKTKEGELKEILFDDTTLKTPQYRRFVMNLYCHMLEGDSARFHDKKKVLLGFENFDPGDRLHVLLKLTDWGGEHVKTSTLDSMGFVLNKKSNQQ